MAMDFSGIKKFGAFLNGSRTDHTIIGCRKDSSDPCKFWIMEANGSEIGDAGHKPIASIANGNGQSIIIYEDGGREMVSWETASRTSI